MDEDRTHVRPLLHRAAGLRRPGSVGDGRNARRLVATTGGDENRTDTLHLEVGLSINGYRLNREGRLRLSEWVLCPPSGARIRLEWEAVQHPGLFPRVDGELVVAPVGPNRTQLSLSAEYKPLLVG